MKCPKCGSDSQVSETRAAPNMTTRRRRECQHGHTFTTIEMYTTVFASAKPRAAVFAATVTKRLALRERDKHIFNVFPKRGWESLGAEFKLTRTAVYLACRRGRVHAREERK